MPYGPHAVTITTIDNAGIKTVQPTRYFIAENEEEIMQRLRDGDYLSEPYVQHEVEITYIGLDMWPNRK